MLVTIEGLACELGLTERCRCEGGGSLLVRVEVATSSPRLVSWAVSVACLLTASGGCSKT